MASDDYEIGKKVGRKWRGHAACGVRKRPLPWGGKTHGLILRDLMWRAVPAARPKVKWRRKAPSTDPEPEGVTSRVMAAVLTRRAWPA